MDTRPNAHCYQVLRMRCCSQQPEQNTERLKAGCVGLGLSWDWPSSSRKLLQLMGTLWLTASPSRWDLATATEFRAEAQMLCRVPLSSPGCLQPCPGRASSSPFTWLGQHITRAGEVLFRPRLSVLLALSSDAAVLNTMCCLTLFLWFAQSFIDCFLSLKFQELPICPTDVCSSFSVSCCCSGTTFCAELMFQGLQSWSAAAGKNVH